MSKNINIKKVVTGLVLIVLALVTIMLPLPYNATMLGVFSTLLAETIIKGGEKHMKKVNVGEDKRGTTWKI